VKICLVTNLYPPLVQGGAEIYVDRLARALAREHRVVVISTEPGFHVSPRVEVSTEGITVYRLAPFNVAHLTRLPHRFAAQAAFRAIDLWHPQVALTMARILRREEPDVVHIHNWIGLSLAGVLSAIRVHAPRPAVAMTLHDYSLLCAYASLWHPDGHACHPDLPCQLLACLNRPLTRSVGLCISPSRYVLQEHERRGFFPDSIRRVLPYGVEVPSGAPALARQSGPGKATFDVLFMGRVQQHKGIETLLRAFRRLPDVALRLHIAGTGPSMEAARALAAGDARVRFYGFVSGERHQTLLQAADCMVVPSLWPDNYPVSIQEAFAAGVVVVASQVGGIPEMVQDGLSGLLVSPGDEAGVATAIDRLRQSPELVRKLRAGGSEVARAADMRSHVARLTEAYASLVEVAGRRIEPIRRVA
jgi:glycosyltransferase involved in cell wall biosynthesis